MILLMFIIAICGLPIVCWYMEWINERYVETHSNSWWSVIHGFLDILLIFAWLYSVLFVGGTVVQFIVEHHKH